MKKSLLVFSLLLQFVALGAFAQQTIRGKVIDSLTKESLPGAVITLKGAGISTSTTPEGTFSIKKQEGTNVLVISYIGYNRKEVVVPAGKTDLGLITLTSSSNTMDEVMIVANNIAIDRKTPVALSVVNSERIAEKGGQQEFPELLKSVPGIYATKGTGGGFGDSRINMRGFQSANIAVMINGIPVNDMEDGRVFWSNWAGLNDVTSSIQVQRGLGASKVAVPSLGGTVNIQTRTTDVKKGGFIYQGLGSYGFNKTTFSYSTGLTDKGWAFSAMGSRNVGDGYVNGLAYEAYSYFFNVSKIINDKHTLSLTGFGAPQYHASRFERFQLAYYQEAPQGNKFNPNYGILDGKEKTISGNYYHKPQVSLNHSWIIDQTSSLSTALYGSIGRGGNEFPNNANLFLTTRTGNKYTPVDIDALVDLNTASPDGSAQAYLQSYRNDHVWGGLMSTYKKKLNDRIDLVGGLDLRQYKGIHYNSVRNLLGAEYVLEIANGNPTTSRGAGDINNPVKMAKTGDKIGFYYDGLVGWQGAFVQGEYSYGNLSAFLSLSGSNTSYQRVDHFKYLDSDPARKSAKVNYFGYQTKGGANYNIDQHHNVFANVGYFEKAPIFEAVFAGYQNKKNDDAVSEKILSYELGYGYRSTKFSGNVNIYRTTWKDRSTINAYYDAPTQQFYTANLSGVDALHQGVEVDFKYSPVQALTINAMLSVGDWKWDSNVPKAVITDVNGKELTGGSIGPLYTKGVKVGDQPQTTLALGASFDVTEDLRIGADYNYFGRYYSSFVPTIMTSEGLRPWQVPSYSLVDVNAVFKFKFAGIKSSMFANVNNLLGTEYISDSNATTFTNGISDVNNANVYYGAGRTWTVGLKVNF
ncbi:iron complex outermembrane receptor protein [Pedobacter africanus]|uniref:Outer membrane receptor protein involved in Fe transport n=1 Tax=Pedobacter africanus TaxID=151894 RepID=A0ACC6L0W8_9SPHI|nr:carboxypeptidase-like regulatory domain-containing protein [Pedobacter africanus]MDR6785070.1 outer membrane receptor protein involved in Fe transport [Pedobacter africanus]